MNSAVTPILTGTDLSPPSQHAVARALQIAKSMALPLELLHARQLNPLESLQDLLGKKLVSIRQALRDDALRQLDMMANKARQEHSPVATLLFEDDPVDALLRQASLQGARLLVVGARGESFLRHALMGSTASRLLRKSRDRPVLVVKQPPHEPYRQVLVGIDFSAGSSAALETALALAPMAHITLLHAFELPYEGKLAFAGVDERLIQEYVRTEQERRLQQLDRQLADLGTASERVSILVRHGDPAQQMIALEQELQADLLVVGKHGRHLIEDLLLGSVTRHVLAESQNDVLVSCSSEPEHRA